MVSAGTTFGAAVKLLLEEYDVERDALVSDLRALVADLESSGLVVVDAT